jgi:hypothetical protein
MVFPRFINLTFLEDPGRAESYVRNSGHFVQLLKSVDLQSRDILVSFDIGSLFTNVPVNEALQVIRGTLQDDGNPEERSALPVEAITELLDVCLRTTYFQVGEFFQQKRHGYGKLFITHCDHGIL